MSNRYPAPRSAGLRLEGKIALVTGAGSGIGQAAAIRFAGEGAKVVLAGRRNTELLKVARAISESGGQAIAVPTDVTIEGEVTALVATAVKNFGRLDIAFNNAGELGHLKPIVELTADDFDRTMAVNLRGVWLLMRSELEAMIKQGHPAVIVNTSSFVAAAASPGTSIYAASKAALDAMIRAVALEVGPHGIRVNNVAPGVIRTPMSAGLDAAGLAALGAHAALKRIGEPEDVADVALWLCTEEARFITGQTVFVDGGFAIPGLR